MVKCRNLIVFGLFVFIVLFVVVVVMKNKLKFKGEKVMVEEVMECMICEMVFVSGKVFFEVEVKISFDVFGEIV